MRLVVDTRMSNVLGFDIDKEKLETEGIIVSKIPFLILLNSASENTWSNVKCHVFVDSIVNIIINMETLNVNLMNNTVHFIKNDKEDGCFSVELGTRFKIQSNQYTHSNSIEFYVEFDDDKQIILVFEK